ncbi:serine O-acetyltransferase [Paenibacillus sp. FJAT-27812]|uniref:serine O-acetyltransferase n=1 Tax=Paenibacillus sp. FJAT-27812 TaxID=1684143 RepID=UPI0006A75E71|nr:serine O-acetyltransferase [Paenibacillus sp. FJAT-27812]
MRFKELKLFWFSDLYRYEESEKVSMKKVFYRQFMLPGFHYMFWFRLCRYLRLKSKVWYPFYAFSMVMLQRYKYKYGISISPATDIGKGFYIGHYGGIVISSKAKIGDNCVIMQGVTIGASNRGKSKGVPTIGNNVYMGAGAKIIGAITIGDHAAIGANAVVTRDVPNNGVVSGIPAEVVSMQGSEGYISFPFPVNKYKQMLGFTD